MNSLLHLILLLSPQSKTAMLLQLKLLLKKVSPRVKSSSKRETTLSKVSRSKDITLCTKSQSVLLLHLEGKFDDALNMYSEAIYCDVPNEKKAIYYNNRALVNLKMENYAIALFGKFYPC